VPDTETEASRTFHNRTVSSNFSCPTRVRHRDGSASRADPVAQDADAFDLELDLVAVMQPALVAVL
jgi:hypothetical protein